MERKHQDGFQVKEIDEKGEGRLVFATMNVIDKDGDVTLKGAFGEQVVPMVPAHDWRSAPIGKARLFEEKEEAVADFKMNLDTDLGRNWYSAIKFDLTHPPSKQEYSYGYQAKEYSFGEFSDQRVRFLKKLKVYEISPVLVGAGNGTHTERLKDASDPVADQLTRAIHKKALSTKATRFTITSDLAKLAHMEQDGVYKILAGDERPTKEFLDVVKTFLGVSLDMPPKNSEPVPLAFSVIDCHSTEVKDGIWDSAAQERYVKAGEEAGYYKRIYAAQDQGIEASIKSAWKFAHHFVDVDGAPGAASTRACIVGIASLNGARGSVVCGEKERRAIWEHLARHLEDADVAPPVLRSVDDTSSKLADQLKWYIWDVEALIERVKDIKDLRAKENRALPGDRVAQIAELSRLNDSLNELIRRPLMDSKTIEALQRFNQIRSRIMAIGS